jgi:hypothetical protein
MLRKASGCKWLRSDPDSRMALETRRLLRRRVRSERTLFFGLLILSAIPILVFQYLPSQDGPAHVANAAVMLNSSQPIIAEYYRVNLFQATNLLADVLMTGMLSVVSASLADKLMALLLLVGLPVSVRWCLHQLNTNAIWLSVLAIPLGAGVLLYYGFYNFLLGVVLSLFTFGLWLKRMRPGHARFVSWAAFALLLGFTYLAHPLPLLALLLMIAAAALDQSLADARKLKGGFIRPAFNLFLPVFLIALVPLAALVAFGSGQSTEIGYVRSLAKRVRDFPLDTVLSLSYWEIPFAILPTVAVGLLGLVALARDRRSILLSPGFPIAMGLLTGLYFLGPDQIGEGSHILVRVALFLFVTALFWLTGVWSPRWSKITAVALVLVGIVGLTAVRIPVHAEMNADIREYLSGQRVIESDSTLLPMWASGLEVGADAGGRRVLPLLHVSGLLMATGDVVDLHHFLAQTSLSPVRFRDGYGLKNVMHIDSTDAVLRLGPILIDVEEYERLGQGQVDYIWLWGRNQAEEAVLVEPQSQRMLQELEDNYELVYVSEPRGLLEVYAKLNR